MGVIRLTTWHKNAVVGIWLHEHHKRVKGWSHYEPFALLEVNLFGYIWHLFLWRLPGANFYNLGKYIRAKVKPLDRRWPYFVHKLYAEYSVKKGKM